MSLKKCRLAFPSRNSVFGLKVQRIWIAAVGILLSSCGTGAQQAEQVPPALKEVPGSVDQQSSELKEYLFIGHPRDGRAGIENVIPSVANLDLAPYDMLLLGGDLCMHSSGYPATLANLDGLFKLGAPTTHWALGNHDKQNMQLVSQTTGRNSFYAYYRNGITLLVLNTELSDGNILDEQLNLLQSVCDSIRVSSHLIVLQHRINWLMGSVQMDTLRSYVAGSSRTLDKTNFYTELLPVFEKVAQKGIEVLILAGDRTNMDMEHVLVPQVTAIGCGIPDGPEFDHHVVLLSHKLTERQLTWRFVSVDSLPTAY